MKNNFPKKILHIILVLLCPIHSIAQGPGSLFVDAGPPVTADCTTGGCVDITATFLETFDTSGSSGPYFIVESGTLELSKCW